VKRKGLPVGSPFAIALARRVEVPARAPGMAALCLVAGTAAAALTAV